MTAADVALAVMDGLRACLCDALTAAGAAACFCGTYPGQQVSADWCTCNNGAANCGMAWVRLDRVYPSTQFPTPDNTARCDTPLAAVIELGVFRCLPTTDARGNPPDAVVQAQAVIDQLRDMGAMHTALTCCAELTRRKVVMGAYTPRDSGGCGGGVWPITVQLLRKPA